MPKLFQTIHVQPLVYPLDPFFGFIIPRDCIMTRRWSFLLQQLTFFIHRCNVVFHRDVMYVMETGSTHATYIFVGSTHFMDIPLTHHGESSFPLTHQGKMGWNIKARGMAARCEVDVGVQRRHALSQQQAGGVFPLTYQGNQGKNQLPLKIRGII